jgi:ClpA/ClpB-like protein
VFSWRTSTKEQIVFERYEDNAREAVSSRAKKEAEAFRHNYIGTEHILLGLLQEEGIASEALLGIGLTVEAVRARVVFIVGTGEEVTGSTPFTPRSKKILEMALRESITLGNNYIGTEHVLLALVRENEGVAARILLDADADQDRVRDAVLILMSQQGKLGKPGSQQDESSVKSEPSSIQIVCGSLRGSRGCKGTGLYKGSAEETGSAVICAHCNGSGAVTLEVHPYAGRVRRNGVTTVSHSRGTAFATGVGAVGPSMTYEQFLESVPAAPIEPH